MVPTHIRDATAPAPLKVSEAPRSRNELLPMDPRLIVPALPRQLALID
jgi:hypothetical protein